eukprot:TRINITY_DN12101_c0_g1_i1.p1 TRINITY_DN12101_c0_g1~~TRINITY_DN12101_c0_g1_i1.p1  ORF type:complete len:109 (+),score=16.36 TRINITY_DN12101_c0_g1_i1:39-329(+)
MYKKARIFDQNGKNAAYEYADKHCRATIGNKVYRVESEKDDPVQRSRALIKSWNLGQYEAKLIDEEGYEDIEDWKELSLEDLMEMGLQKRSGQRSL